MRRIAVFVSGGGTNLQALLDAQSRGEIPGGEIVWVMASRADAYALERARAAGVEGTAVPRKEYPDNTAYSEALLRELQVREIDLLVLAGFLCILAEPLLSAYSRRIINVHPSLIPSFCGPGHYGLGVHRAALAYGVKLTGATVHFVDGVVDGGEIIAQKAVAVEPGDTPELLQRRVMEQAEWVLLPKAVALFCQNKL